MDVLEISLLLIQIAALIHLSNIIYNYCLFAEDNKIFSCIEIKLPNRATKCCGRGDNVLPPSTLCMFGMFIGWTLSSANFQEKHSNCFITFI